MTTMDAQDITYRHLGSRIQFTRSDGLQETGLIRWVIFDLGLVTVAVEWDPATEDCTSYEFRPDEKVDVTPAGEAADARVPALAGAR